MVITDVECHKDESYWTKYREDIAKFGLTEVMAEYSTRPNQGVGRRTLTQPRAHVSVHDTQGIAGILHTLGEGSAETSRLRADRQAYAGHMLGHDSVLRCWHFVPNRESAALAPCEIGRAHV